MVGGHLIYSGAQVVGTVVTEDVADPVGGSGHRMAWLVFVDVGQNTCLLAVPRQEDRDNRSQWVTQKTMKYGKRSQSS